MQLKYLLSALLFVLLTATQCEDEPVPCEDGTIGQMINHSDLDGCSWLLSDQSGQLYEAVNLSDFNIPLVDGKRVCFEYNTVSETGSICMAGPIIRLIRLTTM